MAVVFVAAKTPQVAFALGSIAAKANCSLDNTLGELSPTQLHTSRFFFYFWSSNNSLLPMIHVGLVSISSIHFACEAILMMAEIPSSSELNKGLDTHAESISEPNRELIIIFYRHTPFVVKEIRLQLLLFTSI